MVFALAIAGAAIGGALGFLSAKERNKAIARAAATSQQRINRMMAQSIMDSALRVEQQSRQAQAALGAGLNVSPEHLGSLDAVALQVDGVFSDTDAINEERDRRLEAFGAERTNISTEATNASQNEILAGLQGGLRGFQAGAGLGGAIGEALTASEISDFSGQSRALQLEEQQANTRVANVRAAFAERRMGTASENAGRSRAAVEALRQVGAVRSFR